MTRHAPSPFCSIPTTWRFGKSSYQTDSKFVLHSPIMRVRTQTHWYLWNLYWTACDHICIAFTLSTETFGARCDSECFFKAKAVLYFSTPCIIHYWIIEQNMSNVPTPQGVRSQQQIRSNTTHAGNTRNPGSKHDLQYILNSQGAASSASSSYTPLENAPASAHSASLTPASSSRQKRSKSTDRPFECHICHFSFAQRSDRNKHIRTVHFRERPFMCEYCHQTFGEKGNL